MGFPEITPAEVSFSPDGREPGCAFHLYGAVPPCALRVLEYVAPTFAPDSVPGVTEIRDATKIESGCRMALPLLSLTVTEKEWDPGIVGVPEIRPDAFIVSPGGRLPDDAAQL